jgi:plastocyanin
VTDETIFYILGITLTVSALVVSFLGIRNESFPGGLFPLLAGYFALLVVGTMTFAVLNAETNTTERTENQEAAQELFAGGNAVAATAAETAAPATEPEKAQKPPEQAKGPGGTVKLAADPTELLYDTKKLSSKPGEVTIDFANPAQIEHDVAIASGSEVLGKTELITQGETSTAVELAAGTYDFYCTVPGHREAGMAGTLTVK